MVKNRPVKYMFFANIFVNIDHREIDTIYNIIDLDMIHKSNSMRFLTIVNSFRVLGHQIVPKTACFVAYCKCLANIFVNIDRNVIKYRNHF